MTAFTVDAARESGGPDWLVQRRVAAAERLASLAWPTTREEIWRYSRVEEFDLDRYGPVGPDDLGRVGVERAPGGGPLAAEAGERAGMVVVRDGRIVHCELDPGLEAKGVRLCDIATCDDEQIRDALGRVSAES